jgi:hypothetical protein
MAELSLVYLARLASGIPAFQAFVESYRRHAAGIDHDLVVIYKGFPAPNDDWRRQLDGLTYDEIHLPDRGFDVGSYVAASRQLSTRYICFLNSFSEVLAPGWLAILFDHAGRPGVGAVGATGSWESFLTNYEVESPPATCGSLFRRWARRARRAWTLSRYRTMYPPAPNPHLRSNAFMIERTRWLSLHVGPLRSKEDLWRFESGRASMTQQLLAEGLDVLVVGRDGIAYTKDKWSESSTFRSGNQENLLVADNRTREYDQADGALRQRLAQFAWGDSPTANGERDS